MGTAVIEDDITKIVTAVHAYHDLTRDVWLVAASGGDDTTGIGRGAPGESLDLVLDAALADLRQRVRRVAS